MRVSRVARDGVKDVSGFRHAIALHPRSKMALENFPKLLDLDRPASVNFSPAAWGDIYGALPPHSGPLLHAFEPISTPAPMAVVTVPTIPVEESYKMLGLEPTHGGYLPRGFTPFAATYFVPQPIGIVDPSVYGLHHDWLFGVTYDKLALLYTNPEELARRIEQQKGLHLPPATVKPVRGPQSVGPFDYPFLLFGGGIDYASGNTAPQQTGATFTEQERLQIAFDEALIERLSGSPPGLYPVVFPGGQRAIYEVDQAGNFAPVGTLLTLPDGSFLPVLVKPTNLPAQINGGNAKPPNDQMITERADP